MQLSTSSLNNFLDCERTWLNKQMKLETEDFEYFHYGREGHITIQRHISQKTKSIDGRLNKLDGLYFPVVEERDFDERLRFRLKFGDDEFIGFLDARNDDDKVFADIKISTKLWNMKKFLDLVQRKVYQLAYPGYSFVGITATPDLKEIYVIELPNRPGDAEFAHNWIVNGFERIKTSKFEATEDKNKCFRCIYRKSCPESKYE